MRVVAGAPERRRAPRAAIGSASWLCMPAAWGVQVIDLSLGGLALSSPYDVGLGRAVSVRATLAGEAFNGKARVCWSREDGRAASGRRQFTIGTVFLPLEEESHRALRALLKVSS